MRKHSLILALVLALFWMALSGYFKPMLLSLGVLSIVFVLWLSHRMNIIDAETVPYEHAPTAFPYLTWLSRQIVDANIAVAKAVLKPDMEVQPQMIEVSTDRLTPNGYTNLANSITLTPGTVSVEIEQDHILVHALLDEMTDSEGFAEMDRRAGHAVGEAVTPKLGEG